MKPRYSTVGEEEVSCRDLWRRIGFVRHAAEYWLLASFMLEKISTASAARLDETIPVGGDGGDSRTAPDVGTTSTVEPMLGKYDETSMQQVHDLLADFQKMYITTEIAL